MIKVQQLVQCTSNNTPVPLSHCDYTPLYLLTLCGPVMGIYLQVKGGLVPRSSHMPYSQL